VQYTQSGLERSSYKPHKKTRATLRSLETELGSPAIVLEQDREQLPSLIFIVLLGELVTITHGNEKISSEDGRMRFCQTSIDPQCLLLPRLVGMVSDALRHRAKSASLLKLREIYEITRFVCKRDPRK